MRSCGAFALVTLLLALGRDAGARVAMRDYVQEVWEARDGGLPHPAVTAILQTRDGYLWLGTYGGLVRFNGVEFRRPDAPGALLSDHIRCLAESEDGALWIGTRREGAGRLKDGALETVKATDIGEDRDVRGIAATRDGVVWIAAGEGIVHRSRDGRVRRFTREDGLPGGRVLALAADPEGRVWATFHHFGVGWFDGAGFHGVPLRGAGQAVSAIAHDRAGTMWLAAVGGLLRLDGARGASPEARLTDLTASASALCPAREGGFWVGTTDGLARADARRLWRYRARDGLLSETVNAVYEDREGSLWLGTRVGLARLRPRVIATYTERNGLASDSVYCVLETRGGDLFVGTRLGLSRLHDGTWTTFGTRDGLPGAIVRSLAEGPDGALWIATVGGLARYASGRLSPVPGAPSALRALSQDAAGHLLVASAAGLERLDGKALVPVITKTDAACRASGGSVTFNCLLPTRGGAVWAGTQTSLVVAKDGEATCHTDRDVLARNDVRHLCEDSSGNVWVGSVGGLSRIKGGVRQGFYGGPGPFGTAIYGIAEDRSGFLWCSTPKGLFRIDTRKIDSYAADTATTLYRWFGVAEGMESSVGTGDGHPTAARGADGRLYFLTAAGLAVVDPRRLEADTQPPPVHIEDLIADRQRFPPGRRADLPAGTSTVEVRFAALTFVAPERVEYRYQLEGFDPAWVESGPRRVAYYTNLPPGSYRFRVIAANHNGVWNETGDSLELTIRPHFHQTPVFYALCGAVILGAGVMVHRLRLAQLHARFTAVLAERTRIARELHDTLAQGLAGLGLQLETVIRTLPPEVESTRTRLQLARAMVRSSLAEVRRSIWVLRAQSSKGAAGLARSIAESLRQLAAGTPVEAAIAIAGEPRALDSEVEHQLLRIAHEAVTNAVRHSAAREVRIDLTYDKDGVELRVRDDGRGFDVAGHIGTSRGRHFGVVGMVERARSLRGRLEIDSRPGSGTTVYCFLPYESPADKGGGPGDLAG